MKDDPILLKQQIIDSKSANFKRIAECRLSTTAIAEILTHQKVEKVISIKDSYPCWHEIKSNVLFKKVELEYGQINNSGIFIDPVFY
jgi:hypothetical protein